MKLSTKGRYAMVALADLAEANSDRLVSLAEISERQDISQTYLEQLFGKLRRCGLVKSIRGPGGGYVLSRRADRIAISDIVLAVDEPVELTGYTSGTADSGAGEATKELWEALGNQIYGFLKSVTVADVCNKKISGMGQPAWTNGHKRRAAS